MSEIVPFFNDKTVFLTGATGFIGKLLIEQLLRKCEPKKMYLLIRNKRNVVPEIRLQNLLSDVLFDKLRKMKPNFQERLTIVPGELTEEYLGITEELRRRICDEVDIVIHNAATVRFDEPLRTATNINVKGTISVIKLCHLIKKLQSFIYVSTAFSNSIYPEIKEKIYDHSVIFHELITLLETSDDNQLNNYVSKNLYKWPTIYFFTKAIAENAIKIYGKGLPVAVFRPGIVAPTFNEPISGWTDSTPQLLTGVIASNALGISKIVNVHPNTIADVLPGDKVASCILAIAYKTSLLRHTTNIPIYNYITSKENRVTWDEFTDFMYKAVEKMPPNSMILPSSKLILVSNWFIYKMFKFLEILPVVFCEIILVILNTKPRILKIYSQANKLLNMVNSVFKNLNKWDYSDKNVKDLWKSLNNADKILFNFDMDSINWENYVNTIVSGVRLYVLKESPGNLESAIKKYKRVVRNATPNRRLAPHRGKHPNSIPSA